MPRERLSMRKIKEVLRLRFEQGLSHRAIAVSCGIGITTAREYLVRAKQAGISWPLPEEMDEGAVEKLLYPRSAWAQEEEQGNPEWNRVHTEIRKKGVTLQVLWQEYREMHPEGVGYSRYCELYRAWTQTVDLSMRFEHKGGEKLFVDYAGLTMEVVDPQTGEAVPAQIFVASQGASNCTYLDATPTQGLEDWIGSHVRAVEYFQGVNAIIVPDNTKVAVTLPHRYEPDLNPTYADWARHYGCAVIPARSLKPRDKAKVENAVQGVERRILAPLRDRTFFSFTELNRVLHEKLEEYNARPFQKLEGCRRSLFEEVDRPALRPLPATRYEFAQWRQATVHVDYHVEVDKHRYSVPYRLVKEKVDVRSTQSVVEVFFKGKRVAAHPRSFQKGRFTTVKEHMPKSHREYADWTPERIIRWGRKCGEHVAQLLEQLIAERPHPYQGFRACLGILRLGKHYGNQRLDAACRRALAIKSLGYKSIESILRQGLDQKPLPEQPSQSPAVQHANVRGADYYNHSN